MSDKNSTVADTVHGSIVITCMEKRIMSHPIFNRLHDVYQNSTVYLTFPCNRTKRFEHSVGTMKLCSDMFLLSLKNTSHEIVDEFFQTFQQELITIMDNIKNQKDFIQIYDRKLGGRIKRVPNKRIPDIPQEYKDSLNDLIGAEHFYSTYFILWEAVRIAALLHDVGHPPYSHITEQALDNVRENFADRNDNAKIREFNSIMREFFHEDGEKKKALHEQMGDVIVDRVLLDMIQDIPEDDKGKTFDRQIVDILIREAVIHILSDTGSFGSLHRIIDGTLDGDRLDYVTRDPLNSGFSKGKIEYDRLFSGMIIIKGDSDFWFCPNIKTLNTIEDFLNRRWDLYKNIIFHHRVIKTDYLLGNVIEKIATEYLESNAEEVGENDNELLPNNISGLWKALKPAANMDFSYALCQWDDSWLITVLKKHYFQDYIDNEKNDVLEKQLSELLTNKKYYFSVIKRQEDFRIIDCAIAEHINTTGKNLKREIRKLKALSKKAVEESAKEAFVTIDKFLNNLDMIMNLAERVKNQEQCQEFLYAELKRNAQTFMKKDLISNEKNILRDCIENAKLAFKKDEVDDVFFVVKKYNTGLGKPLLLHNDYQKKDVPIDRISSIRQVLGKAYNSFPQFYIYILKSNKYRKEKIETDVFLQKIGSNIGSAFTESWVTRIQSEINSCKKGEI